MESLCLSIRRTEFVVPNVFVHRGEGESCAPASPNEYGVCVDCKCPYKCGEDNVCRC